MIHRLIIQVNIENQSIPSAPRIEVVVDICELPPKPDLGSLRVAAGYALRDSTRNFPIAPISDLAFESTRGKGSYAKT